MHELIHTWSAQTAAGVPGFATVWKSPHLSAEDAATLEARSGLVMSPPVDTPPLVAHRSLRIEGGWHSVLTRISRTPGAAGDRPGRVAHHLVLPAGERPDYGPVSLLQSGWFLTSRSGTDRHDMPRLPASVGAPPAGPLDDRWANHLASLVLRGTGFIARLPRDVDAIEALRQLEQAIPLERQWDLTFLLGGAAFTDGVLVRLLSAESQPTAAASVLDLAEAEPADTREAPATEAGEAAVLSLEPPERRRAWIIPMVIIGLVAVLALILWNGIEP